MLRYIKTSRGHNKFITPNDKLMSLIDPDQQKVGEICVWHQRLTVCVVVGGGGGEKGVLTVSIDSLLVVSDTGTSRPTKRRARTGGKSSGIGHLRTDPQGEEQEQVGNHQV